MVEESGSCKEIKSACRNLAAYFVIVSPVEAMCIERCRSGVVDRNRGHDADSVSVFLQGICDALDLDAVLVYADCEELNSLLMKMKV